jgi:large subunit ribosomal protein L19
MKTNHTLSLYSFLEKYYQPNALLDQNKSLLRVGDLIQVQYLIPEGDKERIQFYQGVIIAIQNRSLGKSFTLRRLVQGIWLEQIFPAHSPKIVSIIKKQSAIVRRAKLYFLRQLTGKASRLKRKLN